MSRLGRSNEAEQARPGGKVEATAFRPLPGIFDAVPLHGWEQRAELACGEIFQGAESSVEFGGRQAAQAVERAQKIRDRTGALARVAFDTAGNQVAVGIAAGCPRRRFYVWGCLLSRVACATHSIHSI